ncbi:MAG TPA: hypothetical protein PLF91_13205, partial [Mycolicibacterium fallax]|nr:hypothetical protein [Mycolicibacterium fallax]
MTFDRTASQRELGPRLLSAVTRLNRLATQRGIDAPRGRGCLACLGTHHAVDVQLERVRAGRAQTETLKVLKNGKDFIDGAGKRDRDRHFRLGPRKRNQGQQRHPNDQPARNSFHSP